ncbi:galactose-binding domain-like family, partial [Trichomonas vaginalis G3]|uniref:galactose-binding domain-like family n=1 Tax=Trichomonas vaginalis (strain ATCC PRA-98 / G3) TaxID=412133 RepID=UPI0021E612B0
MTDSNSIFKNVYKQNLIETYVSGSASQYINGSIQITKPEYTYDQVEKRYDWCSNIGKTQTDYPWIIYTIKNRIINLKGYYLKSGCCDDGNTCCCYDDNEYCCFCCMYSWSLQVSNDNKTWKTVHKVEKDEEMKICKEKTYHFSETYSAKYVRLIQDEACPQERPCMAINKLELLGKLS